MANYIMYNQDIPVARFVYQHGTMEAYQPQRPELLPKQIADTSADGFAGWLRERAIDMNTLQHRNLMYDLLGTRDKLAAALETHMFSLSDTFTCFPENEFIPRAELCSPQDQEAVSNYILVSSDTSLRMARIATPCSASDGTRRIMNMTEATANASAPKIL